MLVTVLGGTVSKTDKDSTLVDRKNIMTSYGDSKEITLGLSRMNQLSLLGEECSRWREQQGRRP